MAGVLLKMKLAKIRKTLTFIKSYPKTLVCIAMCSISTIILVTTLNGQTPSKQNKGKLSC